MLRIFFCFFLIIVFQFHASAQEIYSVDREGSWEFTWSPSRQANRADNQIINQLALAHRKIPEKTSFNFHFSYSLSLNYGDDSRLHLMMKLMPSVSTGDVKMNGFNLSEVLVPGKCSFIASLTDVYGEVTYTSPLQEILLEDIREMTLISNIPDSLWSKGSSLKVDFRSFSFTPETYAKAERELVAVMNYIAAVSLSDTLENRIRKNRVKVLSPDDAFGVLTFSSKSIRLLSESVNTRTILVPGSDHGQLQQGFSVNQFRNSELKKHLTNKGSLSANTGNTYLTLADAYGDVMRDVITITRKTDHQSSPFYYRLFSNCLSLSQIREMGVILGTYAQHKKISGYNPYLLSMRILREIELFSDELMEEGRYAEAVDLLASGEKFAKANPAVFVPLSLTAKLKQSRSGLTLGYTRIVQKALAGKLPDLAQKYLTEAEQYAVKYDIAELEASGLSALYQQMAGQHIAKGNEKLIQNEFIAALSEFDKALDISISKHGVKLESGFNSAHIKAVNGVVSATLFKANQFVQSGVTGMASALIDEALSFSAVYPQYQINLSLIDSLRTEVANLKFVANINEALTAKRNFETERAIENLVEAALLKRDFRIRSSADYDTLLVKVIVPHLNSIYSNGRLKLWAGEPDEALTIAGEGDYLAELFGLASMESIARQRIDLQISAGELLCSRITGELESLINQADDLLKNNRFSAAEPVIAEARELIFNRSYCGLNTGKLNEVIGRHRNSIRWNNTHKESLSLIEAGDFINGIAKLQEAEAIFKHYQLDTLGLLNSGLFELAFNSSQLPLLQYSTDYFIARNKPDHALVLLDKIRQTGATAESTRPYQESLARIIAKRDLEQSEAPEIKNMLRIYTNGDKWYKRFSEAYTFHVNNR